MPNFETDPDQPQDTTDSDSTSDSSSSSDDSSSSSSSTVFYAACESAHGISGQWMGPNRDSHDAAQVDADLHVTQNLGHEPSVLPY
jgi:hypothetical protein